jgi:hypothetical protein
MLLLLLPPRRRLRATWLSVLGIGENKAVRENHAIIQ